VPSTEKGGGWSGQEAPLAELSGAQLKAVHDAYFVHLLEDEETRESGLEGRDFDEDAEPLEALDGENRHEYPESVSPLIVSPSASGRANG
jgi:hypothetical protein